jgi:hypothetical protein
MSIKSCNDKNTLGEIEKEKEQGRTESKGGGGSSTHKKCILTVASHCTL